ncbi:Hypothetical predicted protein [Marmota monax]|uniref:Uncharacterized protein n=1 Tax=Marmota monax TaxID=9995 RepID=A0A5E4CAB7_MARMO|nr:small integral membrane protein 30 isoform X1 [Marmota marmota marmota]KAF7476378.1 hypothetical protein GHT09_012501 [Marmota monax]VTJ78139.1 Hypothetical predicted protein [Marmota monax]
MRTLRKSPVKKLPRVSLELAPLPSARHLVTRQGITGVSRRGLLGNVVRRLRPPHHSCNGCFPEGGVTCTLLASASGAPKREYFKSDRFLYMPFRWNL